MFKSQFEMFGVGWDGKPHPLLEAHLPADRPIPTLEELAEEANIVMESEFDYGPEVFERSPKNTALDLLRLQYAHCECRYFAFALRELTGWPIVLAVEPGGLLCHQLNRDAQGRLVDVTGFVTLEELPGRYRGIELEVREGNNFEGDGDLDDDAVAQVMAAMLYLPHEPFTSLSAQASLWVRYGRVGLDGPWRAMSVSERKSGPRG